MIQTEEERLVPELRFPEFEGEWVKMKLGEALNITSSSRASKMSGQKKFLFSDQ